MNTLKKMPLYDMGKIKDSAKFYNKDADVYLEEYIAESTISVTREMFDTTLNTIMEFKDIFRDPTMEIIINQLRDPEVFDRAIFVTDGSYRKNRVWLNISIDSDGIEELYLSVEMDRYNHDSSNPIPIENRIQYILDNYDNIFIQIHMYESIEELMKDISWKMSMRNIDIYDELDYD